MVVVCQCIGVGGGSYIVFPRGKEAPQDLPQLHNSHIGVVVDLVMPFVFVDVMEYCTGGGLCDCDCGCSILVVCIIFLIILFFVLWSLLL